MQGVQKAESTQNFSEIITGLSQCAYGSSPLKTNGETKQNDKLLFEKPFEITMQTCSFWVAEAKIM